MDNQRNNNAVPKSVFRSKLRSEFRKFQLEKIIEANDDVSDDSELEDLLQKKFAELFGDGDN